MLGKRIVTALIGISLAIFIVHRGQWIFSVSVLLLTLVAWHEFSKMLLHREIKVSYNLGMLCLTSLWGCAWLGSADETVAVLIVSSFVILGSTVLSSGKRTLLDAVFSLAGIMYIGLAFSHLILLRFVESWITISSVFGPLPVGIAYIWMAFLGTWASDTFAYFIGTKFGKHRLAPTISPGKTWEGFIGGVVGSVIGVLFAGWMFNLSPVHACLIGLLVGVFAPLGDLVESSIKRYSGVKDSGRLLPGHGGVLDRFDSILFAVPIVYYYTCIVILRDFF